jgi:hypothetical protein
MIDAASLVLYSCGGRLAVEVAENDKVVFENMVTGVQQARKGGG